MKKINSDIENNTFEKVYLLYGNEPYLINQLKNHLKRGAAGDTDDLNITVFQGKKTDVKDIIDICETLPFLSERRVVIVEDSDLFGKRSSDLPDKLSDIPDTTVLIFAEEEVDARSRLYKAVSKEGYAVRLDTPDKETLFKWAAGLIKREGKKISAADLDHFLSSVSNGMDNILNELKKLFSYLGTRANIERKDIDEVCSFKMEDKVFEMIDLMAAGESRKALKLYNDQLKLKGTGRSTLALIQRHFEQLILVKELYDKGIRPTEIADKLGIKKWLAEKRIRASVGFSLRELKEYAERGIQVTDDINSGRMEEGAAIDIYVCSLLNRK